MGNMYDKHVAHPATTPVNNTDPKFDPNLGFPNGRKERVMLATKEEMDSARIVESKRDYCAHVLLKLLSCKSEHWPWTVKCHHQKEDYVTCQFEDYVLRMKEYEREKRLLRREQRIAERQAG